MTDQLALLAVGGDDRPWTGQLISPPAGRTDDWFRWPGGAELHPHVVRSVLAQAASVIEYQVHQTPQGFDLAVVGGDDIDTAALTGRLTAELDTIGLPAAAVQVQRVASLPRHAAPSCAASCHSAPRRPDPRRRPREIPIGVTAPTHGCGSSRPSNLTSLRSVNGNPWRLDGIRGRSGQNGEGERVVDDDGGGRCCRDL